MNYHNITKDDMLNGDGLRVVLWVSGCSHNCKNCQNPQTHDYNSGIEFDNNTIIEIVSELKKDYISGITFSGGDPLSIFNRNEITLLSQYIKKELPNKTQWLYTGYNWNDIKNLPIMKTLDVVIDGKYEENKRDITLAWRGSSNQNVINVQRSLKEGVMVLWTE